MNTFQEQNNQLTLLDEKNALFFSDNAFNDENDYIYVLDTNALLKIFQLDIESIKIFEKKLSTKKNFLEQDKLKLSF